MKVIEVNHLKKKYALYSKKTDKIKEAFSISKKEYHREFWALKDIDFSIEKGECVGIIGLNGSGKSTLLKILTDVIVPTEGFVKVNGRVSALLELGAGFNPDYTGMENIYLNTMLMGMTRDETRRKLNAILEFADIGDFINQPVKVYSSGMFVRLAFSIAIAVEPDILIVDEALSVGDVFFQQKCYQKMREFIEKTTVLIVSHDMSAITKLCTRCMVMDKGKIIFDGDTKNAVTEYFKLKQGVYLQEKKKPIAINESERVKEGIPFRKPKVSQYSGQMDVVIEEYYYDADGVQFAQQCEKNKRITVIMKARATREIDDLIVGYQVRNKYGDEVFGETSLTSGYTEPKLIPGFNLISFSFIWPEVREGVYFITLGIGEGKEVLVQTELCWINEAICLDNTTRGKLIYGVFNNAMETFTVSGLGK